ncbi:MAG: hypothetical protein COA78_08865 [Blastopirellula sp.]|nr:MAG: hypothetical protein COA78_08865 [Blastopirellula sp.]
MARRPAPNDDESSLDSLLDTMLNVVGILVMVIVLVQIGIQQAVDRIGESQAVDPAALVKLIEDLEQAQIEKIDLDAELASLHPDEENIEDQLKRLEERVADENKKRKLLEEEKKNFDENNRTAIANQEKIEEHKEQRTDLSQQISTSLKDISTKQALLEDREKQKAPPAKVVNLPNPRPAPAGIKAAMFVCSENQVFPLDLEGIRTASKNLLESTFKKYKQKYTLEEGKNWKIDGKQLVEDFNKRSVTDKYFDVSMEVFGDVPRLVLTPKKNAGARIAELEGANGGFRKDLRTLDGNKFYARFFVKPDSYEAYVSARKVVQEENYLAGWEPQGAAWVYRTNLGGKLRFAPPPPPKPVDPNAKPTPPIKPPNVLD